MSRESVVGGVPLWAMDRVEASALRLCGCENDVLTPGADDGHFFVFLDDFLLFIWWNLFFIRFCSIT